jgi:hypothetical protein
MHSAFRLRRRRRWLLLLALLREVPDLIAAFIKARPEPILPDCLRQAVATHHVWFGFCFVSLFCFANARRTTRNVSPERTKDRQPDS